MDAAQSISFFTIAGTHETGRFSQDFVRGGCYGAAVHEINDVDTNLELRKEARWLIDELGIVQKRLAAAMGMKESTFSKWLNNDPSIGPARTTAIDGLRRFQQTLQAKLAERETQRAAPSAAAGGGFRPQPRKRRS